LDPQKQDKKRLTINGNEVSKRRPLTTFLTIKGIKKFGREPAFGK